MEASVEARLHFLEERVRTLEARVGAEPAPTPAPPPAPVVPKAPPVKWELERPAPAEPRQPLDLEELLGARVLGLVGGIAVLLAAVFFLVMAVHNGWIGVATRVVLAFVGSAALLAAGVWLYERKGKTQAALAAVGAALAALYASDTTATAVYHLIPAAAGLVVAGAIGIAATVLAVRWNARTVAGLGIAGALLGPVLVDAGATTTSLAFMAVALVAAVGVLLWRRWSWLAVLAYVVSAPQAAGWIANEREAHLGIALAVTALFWALYVVAALGYEVRVRTEELRLSTVSLLLGNAAAASAGGWELLHASGHGDGATAWVFGLAAAHAVLAVVATRLRISREIGALLVAVAAVLTAIGLALALGGPALVAGWTAEAVAVAWLARRLGDERGFLGSGGFLLAAGIHALVYEAPPKALAYGTDSLPTAVGALALVAAGVAIVAALLPEEEREAATASRWITAAVTVYLGSILVVDLAGAHVGSTTQTSQLALSAFWAILGFTSFVAGLARDRRPLRLGGLALLGVTVGKVFLVDLATLESGWRVGSFLALGLLLLAGAFAYQRTRPRRSLSSSHPRGGAT